MCKKITSGLRRWKMGLVMISIRIMRVPLGLGMHILPRIKLEITDEKFYHFLILL